MGCVTVGPGFTTILYVLVEGQPLKVEVMVKTTVFAEIVVLLMVKAGIVFPIPELVFKVTPAGTVVAIHENVLPVSATNGTATVAEPEQIDCVGGFKAARVGAVPIAKV